MNPGDKILVSSGRHRGSVGVLLRIEDVPTPSGGSVRMAEIERPRAGRSWELASDLRRPEDEPVPRQADPGETFR